MNRPLSALLCRALIALMVWMPFQLAQASMIDTGQALSSGQADRASLLNLLDRSEVASHLQALGLDSATAKERVMAMTDSEAGTLARQIDSLPAGASGSGLLLIIIIVAVLWWAFK
jgi:hypothetical protein